MKMGSPNWVMAPRGVLITTLLAALMALAIACGSDDGEDRPTVEVLNESGSVSGSVSSSASGSASGSVSGWVSSSSSGSASGPAGALGGYVPVSDVATHALVVSDVADINALLGESPIDWDAVKTIYVDGKNSVKSDGSVRTIAGFASNDGRSEAIWDDFTSYYGDQKWLDTFAMSAIEGTAAFEGESDGVRKQGAQKGIQNQIMIAWVIHELVAAMEKAADGNFDPASGAPHNWDEGWAFYHGVDSGNGPFATADKRGSNFGTGSAVNDALLQAMIDGRDALVDGDTATAQAAMDEAVRQIQITYIQATIRYASKMADDLASGDTETARVHQAEGLSFFRVIEPMVASASSSAAEEIAGFYELSSEPNADAGDAVKAALESVYDDLGIDASEIGSLQ